MNARKAGGIGLLSAPVLAFLTFCIVEGGWDAVLGFGIVAAIMACFVGGSWLIGPL